MTSGVAAASGRSEEIRQSGVRNAALDFTKGALVLLMILYHWTNYFVTLDESYYKYLRFITPSFIFITGFLIANVYLGRYEIGDPRLHLRLLERGFKLLVIFTGLNLAASVLLGPGPSAFLQNASSTYLTGNGKTAVFSVLVPISYVLIFSSVLLLPCQWFKSFLSLVCAIFFLAILILHLNGLASGNLELFTMGLLGMVLGGAPLQRIDRFAGNRWLIAATYALYLVMITRWNEIYPLQVVGVCLSLLFIYSLALKMAGSSHRWIVLLGKYTLLAYITQIAVLVLLSWSIRRFLTDGAGRVMISFVGAFALTYFVVQRVDRLRARWTIADRMYKFVFA